MILIYEFIINSFRVQTVFFDFQTETRGLTGLVKFDRDGYRSNVQLDIVRLMTENGLTKIGVWNSTSSGNIEWLPDIAKKSEIEQRLQNQTFIVLISLTAPYGMQTESWTTLSGNERYEGFGIDIIEHISKLLGFNYTLQVESTYGSLNEKTGKWTGMLGKIIADVGIQMFNNACLYLWNKEIHTNIKNVMHSFFQEAHLAITDLTITSERSEAVDFTMPFMNLVKYFFQMLY